MIRTVISDLGKVILWFDNRIFFRKMTRYCAFPEDKIRDLSFAHPGLIESFDKGKITPREFYSRIIEKLQAQIDYDDFFSIYSDVFSLNAPVLQTVKRLKANYKLVLLSNTDVMRFGFVKKKFPEILIFDKYVLSFEVGFMKPHPQIYREALKKAGSRASECLFIDDIEENVDAALRLGIDAIHFKPETNLEKALQEKGLSFV